MAKKNDIQVNLFDTFKEFKETKNIDRTILISVIEDSFRSVIQKQFGTDENYDIIVNPDKGDFEIYRNRIIVADNEVEDQNTQIGLTEARKIDEDFEIGEEVAELYVDYFFWEQGVGSKLLEFAKEKLGVCFLWALEKNTDAIRFYEAHGFHDSGERKPEEGTKEYLIKMEL